MHFPLAKIIQRIDFHICTCSTQELFIGFDIVFLVLHSCSTCFLTRSSWISRQKTESYSLPMRRTRCLHAYSVPLPPPLLTLASSSHAPHPLIRCDRLKVSHFHVEYGLHPASASPRCRRLFVRAARSRQRLYERIL